MMAPKILVEEKLGWRSISRPGGVLWFKGVLFGDEPNELADRLEAAGVAGVAEVVSAVDGHFALVFVTTGWVVAATDRVGTIPLSYAGVRGDWTIGSNATRVAAATNCETVDSDAFLSLAMSGYTIGRKALLRGIYPLEPGECVVFKEDGSANRIPYYVYKPISVCADEEALVDVMREVFSRMIESLDGRMVLVPLSAGLDSRLIVSALHELRYDNVKCFSYGQSGNYEARAGEQIAASLGFPWTFVANSPDQQRRTHADGDWVSFIEATDTLQAIPFQQDFYAVGEIKRSSFAPEDAIFINGQSGDFISGNHIPQSLLEPAPHLGLEDSWRRILNAAIDKHFSLWSALKTPANVARVETEIRRDLEGLDLRPDDPACDYALFEGSEYKNRQSKYVVAGQRTYEWFGYEWRLPLWTNDFIEFWRVAPPEQKFGQKLYHETLRRLNWGGVWSDGYWPKQNVVPAWMRPVRFAAKVAHAPFGRGSWRQFEKRFLAWRTDPTSNYAATPYWTVARDKLGHRNAISWVARRYIESKGLTLEGLISEGGQN